MGREYSPGKGTFKTDLKGLEKLRAVDRLEAYGDTLSYRRFASDFPYRPLSNIWTDTMTGGYAEQRYYVVQTVTKSFSAAFSWQLTQVTLCWTQLVAQERLPTSPSNGAAGGSPVTPLALQQHWLNSA